MNHVINYIPQLNLYVDATAKHQPFGVLPLPLRGKPVLHVGQWRDGAEVPDATVLTDEFSLTLTLTRVERFVRLPVPGAFFVMPLVGGTTVGGMVQADDGEPVRHDTACTNGVAVETYLIELPKGMKMSGLPPPLKLASSVCSSLRPVTRKKGRPCTSSAASKTAHPQRCARRLSATSTAVWADR